MVRYEFKYTQVQIQGLRHYKRKPWDVFRSLTQERLEKVITDLCILRSINVFLMNNKIIISFVPLNTPSMKGIVGLYDKFHECQNNKKITHTFDYQCPYTCIMCSGKMLSTLVEYFAVSKWK